MAKFHLQENETLIGSGLMACKHKKSPASQLFYINFLLKIVGETPARRATKGSAFGNRDFLTCIIISSATRYKK